MWERWNSVLPDGHLSGTGMNSLNHYAYGAIVEWMYRYMCGLNPVDAAPGYRKFVLKPYVDDRFESAALTYDSACGRIASSWKKTEEGYEFQVTVPFDTEAEFVRTMEAEKMTVIGAEKSCETAENTIFPGTRNLPDSCKTMKKINFRTFKFQIVLLFLVMSVPAMGLALAPAIPSRGRLRSRSSTPARIT